MRERTDGSATTLQRARSVIVALAVLGVTNAAYAQTGTGVVAASAAPLDRIVVAPRGQRLVRPVPHGLDLALRPTWWTSTRSTSALQPSSSSAFQPSSSNPPRSTRRKVIGGVIGAVGGFFGGGFLGAAIEGDRCDCDDPGFVGFWIGAPVGSVLGGIAGAKWL